MTFKVGFAVVVVLLAVVVAVVVGVLQSKRPRSCK